MERTINGHTLTSNEELDSILPGDSSVEVTGVITLLDPPNYKRRSSNYSNPNISRKFDDEEDKKKDNTPFRCIFSNLLGRQIRVLFWQPKKKNMKVQF